MKLTTPILLILLTFINSANAFDFLSAIDIAKKEISKINFPTSFPKPAQPTAPVEDRGTINITVPESSPTPPVKLTPANQSEDSTYIASGKNKAESKWIMAQVEFNGSSEQIIFNTKGSTFQKKFFLRQGPGKYTISFFETNGIEKYRSNYYKIDSITITNLDTRNLSYLLPTEEVQSDDSKIIDLAAQITADSNTENEKIKAIHDYVANLVTYDYDSLVDKKFEKNPMDAISILESPLTVCSGYSNLTAALLRAVNIRARIIHGKVVQSNGIGDHAWNEVMVKGEWKSLDVTWDDVTTLRYDYFLPDEATFQKDHRKEKVLETN